MTSTRAPGLLFIIEKGRGVHVGDAEASARQAYAGRAVITPHKYSPSGYYLLVRTADRKRAVVIETNEGKVVAVRGGQQPAVEYVEGCS